MSILNLQIGSSTDDVSRRLNPSFFSLTAVDEFAGRYDSSNYQYGMGLRFNNVTIPKSATISSAYLTLTASSSYSGSGCYTRIRAENVDNATTFIDNSGTFDVRWANSTTAVVDWDTIPSWTAGSIYNSPEIKTVVQEVINRAGWSSGNSIVIFWEDFDFRSVNAANNLRAAVSYDGTALLSPKLYIDYVTGDEKTNSRMNLLGVGL